MQKFILCLFALLHIAFSIEIFEEAGYKLDGDAPSDEFMRVTFFIKHSPTAISRLENKLEEVSHPRSEKYGQYLNKEQIRELVNCGEETATVEKWLIQNNIPVSHFKTVSTNDAIVLITTVSNIQKLFKVELSVFSGIKSNKRTIKTLSTPSMPKEVQSSVELITGLTNFSPIKEKRSKMQAVSNSTIAGTPANLLVLGGVAKIKATFIPVCLDGSLSNDASKPCSETSEYLIGVSVDAQTSSPIEHTYSNGFISPSCELVEENLIYCSVSLTVNNYVPITSTTVYLIFSSGSVGPKVTYSEFGALPAPVVTPKTLKSLYNIPMNAKVTNSKATQSVGEFEQQYYNPNDLNKFMTAMGLNTIPDTNDIVTVVGPNPYESNSDGVEANLDIQYIMGLAPGSPTTFWSIYANSTAEIDNILEWANEVLDSEDPPLVHSLSYGMAEKNVDRYLGFGYLKQSDIAFMKLALRGLTVIIADGDTGAGDLGTPPMSVDNCRTLHPDWPSQSPFVLAIGSTFISPLSENVCQMDASEGGIDCSTQALGEISVGLDQGTSWTTGGGFSDRRTRRPAYQSDFVNSYLELTNNLEDIPSYAFNIEGRAYPDAVAVGHNLWICNNGSFFTVDGTSASAPIFAAIVTLLNNERLNAGLSPVGFLNPLLYEAARSMPGAFNDITFGKNRGGAIGTHPATCPWGFESVPGFDSVSGLGSPNYPVLLEAVMTIPYTMG